MTIMRCPECGAKVSTRAAACPHCGCPVEPPTPEITCSDCGEGFAVSLNACPECGGPVEDLEQAREPSEPTTPVAAAESGDIDSERPVPVIESVGIRQTDLSTLYTSLDGRISRQTYEVRRRLHRWEAALKFRDRESGFDVGVEFSLIDFPGARAKF